ncbi:MAG TPA: bifunctional cytidylyltransferase/SDR family oxidoreductase [Jatrophihabitans sp.]|nr:bifunctional cytidylyltransferase/SDR family oxidoreductase [Jatrophihabitans sp.]
MSGSGLPTVAVVLAGGTGSRVGLDRPKQLLKVAGRTVIEHTVAALCDCPEIDEIVVMMASDYVAEAEELLLGRPHLPKVTRVLSGGGDRNESTRRALAALGDRECNVLFHDAVRPLLPTGVVAACVEALREYEAVDVAIASADTIVRVDGDGCIIDIPDRSRLRRGQTPQGFRLSTIRRAYELAAADPDFRATDDCGVVLRYLPEVPIYVVPGDEMNMKVTYPIDLFLIDKLFQLGSHLADPHTPAELEAALGGRTVVIFGGSYGIGADVARLAEKAGARVFPFSRSSTGTYVERPETVVRALEQVYAETGRIDAVVVSAAQLGTGRLAELGDEDVRQQLDVNLLGPVAVARASEKYLRETAGHLVLFTSSSYTRGRAEYALYSATKAAVVNLAQALADEWSPAGIRVNVVNPERTRTPMRLQAFGEEPEYTLLKSEVVAATVVDLLASDLTGQVVDIRRTLVPESEAVAEAVTEAVAESGVPPATGAL